jgi:hypothetical protein
MNIHSTKQSTVRTGTSITKQPFSAKLLQELASEEEPNIPQPFVIEKYQKLPEGKAALFMNEASFMSPPVSNDVLEEVSQQRHTRGKYSLSKIFKSLVPVVQSLPFTSLAWIEISSETPKRAMLDFLKHPGSLYSCC